MESSFACRIAAVLVACSSLATAMPTGVVGPPPPKLPPVPLPTVTVATVGDAFTGVGVGPNGPVVAVGTSAGIVLKDNKGTLGAIANTNGRGGGGPLFATIKSSSTSEAKGRLPVVANSITTLVGTKDAALGLSISTASGVGGGLHNPGPAVAVVSLASALATKNLATSQSGSGTLIADGGKVTSSTEGEIEKQKLLLQQKVQCKLNGGKKCPH